MDIKKFWKETFGGFVLKNLLIAIVVIVALSWIALIFVDYYTHHGESEVVPDLRGMYVEEAQVLLAKKGLYVQVIDSVYVRDKKLGTIISQTPPANSNVKTNRPVYLVINSRNVRQISLPEIIDVSFRQADAMLQSVGLSYSNVEYVPSEFKDLVTEVKYRGRSILPGTRVPQGSSVVLVVGSGIGEGTDVQVPSLKGMSLEEATQIIDSTKLSIGAVEYDDDHSGNESDYIIYRQRPGVGSLPAGSRIDLYLSRDKSRLKETFEEDKKAEETDEQFF